MTSATHPFPEGGTRAWLVLIGASCMFFSAFGSINSFGAYEDYYVNRFLSNHSAGDVSWIGSVQLCLQAGVGLLSGAAFDKGYFHHAVGLGSVLFVFSMFMLSLAQPMRYYQVLLSQGIGVGIGLGLIFVPTISVISHYFSRRRAFAVGLTFAGSSVGGVVLPIMVNRLLNGRVGFANGVRAHAGVIAVMLVIGNLLMRPRPEIQVAKRMVPDLKAYMKDKPYILAVLSAFFVQPGLFFPLVYLQLDARQHGVPADFAFYLLAILNGASFFGRIAPNFLADKFGVFKVQIATAASCSFIVLGMLGINNGNKAGVGIIAGLYGFFSGANLSLLGPLVAEISPSMQELGARTGFLYIFAGVASLIGNPISGWLLTDQYHWWRAIIWSVLTLQVSVWLLVLADYLHVRKRKQDGVEDIPPSYE